MSRGRRYVRAQPNPRAFDDVAPLRSEGGELDSSLYRDAKNPSVVFAVFRWKDEPSARAFFESDQLNAKMAEAGVVGTPTIHVLNEG